MPTQWSEAEQVPLGCIAPHTAQRCHSEPVLTLAWESVLRARRRGTPKPPSVREVARSAGGRDMLRQRRSIKLKGTFRAPARGTFAPGGKSTKKRRSNLRFENPLRAFTCRLSCSLFPRERCAVQTSPKCCIVSAPLFAAAFALKCRAVWFFVSWQDRLSNGGL